MHRNKICDFGRVANDRAKPATNSTSMFFGVFMANLPYLYFQQRALSPMQFFVRHDE